MNRLLIKWYSDILGVSCFLLFVSTMTLDAQNLPEKKIVWEYSIKYQNLPAANLIIQFVPGTTSTINSYSTIIVTAKNQGVFSFLFKIDNYYKTRISTDTFLPVTLLKKISQKNIQQEWTIHYNSTSATIDSLSTWEIPANCHNYFSMLFFLRTQPLRLNDIYHFNLDAEYLCWNVRAHVAAIENLQIDQQFLSALKVVLTYENAFPDRKNRPWKTDLLTNRIAGKSKKMIIWYSTNPERIVFQVVYDENARMQLKEVHAPAALPERN